MAAAEFTKLDIAVSQLETALRLYFDGGDLFSVITLAGAAEEILGRELQSRKKDSALDTDKAATAAISKAIFGRPASPKAVARLANRARNELKHMDPGGPRTVRMDPEDEANAILDRAILNYWRLTEDETPNMGRFLRERYSG
jgi:hypothetical protein